MRFNGRVDGHDPNGDDRYRDDSHRLYKCHWLVLRGAIGVELRQEAASAQAFGWPQMKISELVEVLNRLKSEHGDVKVFAKVDFDWVELVEFQDDAYYGRIVVLE
jgi:hypothetical protein